MSQPIADTEGGIMTQTLERCEDCRAICLCWGECTCMTTTVVCDTVALLCHGCVDERGY